MQNVLNSAPLSPPSTPSGSGFGPYPPPPTPEKRIGKVLGESLELQGILGTGAYGVVYSALDLFTNIWYAVKALSKTNANGTVLDRRQQAFQSREISLHYAACAHPNIVTMRKIVDEPDCTYVILDFCPDGDLFSNITERGQYVNNDPLVRNAFLQILDAVEHCHSLGIYHRDLKPENILVCNSGTEVKLADFGLATTDPESEDHGCGSTFYMSPECLDPSSRKPSYQCAPNDVWSLGVILVNLTCGRNPWKEASVEDSTYRAFTRNRHFLKTILPLSDELNDILGMIFERNPEDRITVGQLKRRIFECSSFSAQPHMLATPPQSPIVSAANISQGLTSSSTSNEGSIISDEGSLTGSCSTVSDDTDFDSGYESMEQECVNDTSELLRPTPYPRQYVCLPQEEPFSGQWPAPNPTKQNWPQEVQWYGHYDPLYAVSVPHYHVPHYQYSRVFW
jgi:serine/threonine protein kinase